MFGSLKSQRTSLVPFFKLLEKVVQVKQTLDDMLDICEAVVAPEDHPEVGSNPGWGEKDVPAIFRPLLSSPNMLLKHDETDELDLSGLEGLNLQVIEYIQDKAREKLALSRDYTYEALNTYDGLFRQMYHALADFANGTSDIVWIFLQLYSIRF